MRLRTPAINGLGPKRAQSPEENFPSLPAQGCFRRHFILWIVEARNCVFFYLNVEFASAILLLYVARAFSICSMVWL